PRAPGRDARGAGPRVAADLARARGAHRRARAGRAGLDPARAADRHAPRHVGRPDRAGEAAAAPARVDPRRRSPAREAAPAPGASRLRLGPDAARQRRAAARDPLDRSALADREPRPCDVVPPRLPRRRAAALRADEPGRVRRARPRPGLALFARRPPRRLGRAGGTDAAAEAGPRGVSPADSAARRTPALSRPAPRW